MGWLDDYETAQEERLRRRFDEGDPDECWLWLGYVNTRRGGYGEVYVRGGMKLAHRAVYELLVGPIPKGLEIDHLCRTRCCVNPNHLEPVTRAENMRRMWANFNRAEQPARPA